MLPVSLVVAFRGDDVGTDTYIYRLIYSNICESGLTYDLEYGFLLLAKVASKFSCDVRIFFGIISTITLAGWGFLMREIFRFSNIKLNRLAYSISFLIFSFSPFFFSGLINIIRQGVATPLLILGFLFLTKRENKRSIACFMIASSFHLTTLVFVLSAIVFYFRYRVRVLIISTLVILYGFGGSRYIIESSNLGMVFNVAEYGIDSDSFGVRFDFMVFTIFTGGIFWFLGLREWVLKIYWILFIPFLLFGFSGFPDRWLNASWGMLPIMLTLLVLQSKIINNVMCRLDYRAEFVLITFSYILAFLNVRAYTYSFLEVL